MLESKKPNTPSLKVKTNYTKFYIIFSSNTLLCNYFPNNKRTIQICNYCLQLIWMQLEVGRWILLWKCVCSAVSLWYTRRFEQINACTKPSGKEEKNTGREEKKEGTLEHIISTNRPVADGNDLCLPVERSTKILLAALLLSSLQKGELLIFAGVGVLEVDPLKLIPPSHKSMKNYSSCPPGLIQR